MWADVGSCFVAIAYDVRLARRGGNGTSSPVLGYMMHILKISSDPNYNEKRFHGHFPQILPHTVELFATWRFLYHVTSVKMRSFISKFRHLTADPRVLRVWDSCAHVRRRSNRPGMAVKASVARHTSSRPPGGEFEFEFESHPVTVVRGAWIVLGG